MQAQSAQKNWEAQARTNSILAGSLKALEERVEDCAALLDWRHEVDLKFEEVAEQLQSILNRQKEVDSAAKRQHRDLQSQLHHSSGGGGGGGEGGGAGEEDGDEGEHSDVVVEVPLWRRCYRVTTGREGYYMWYGVLLMLQMVAIFGLFVSAAQDADSATQSVAGILGASSVVGLLVAIPAIYRGKPLFLNAYLVCQIWTCAMAAVFTADAIQDVFKSYNFCMLRGVGGVPDDGCATREIRARGKVFYSLCTALMTITVGGVALTIKDGVAREEVEALVRSRGRLATITASAKPQGSIMTSRSMARISQTVQPSWKGQPWQSQQSTPTPSAKLLLQQIGQA